MIRLEALQDELVNYNYSSLENLKYTSDSMLGDIAESLHIPEYDLDLLAFYIAYTIIIEAGIDSVTESELQFIQDRVYGLQLDDTVTTIANLL